ASWARRSTESSSRTTGSSSASSKPIAASSAKGSAASATSCGRVASTGRSSASWTEARRLSHRPTRAGLGAESVGGSEGRADDMLAIGLMSGTSADGIDAALVDLEPSAGGRRCELRAFVSQPYPEKVRRDVFRLFDQEAGDTPLLCQA